MKNTDVHFPSSKHIPLPGHVLDDLGLEVEAVLMEQVRLPLSVLRVRPLAVEALEPDLEVDRADVPLEVRLVLGGLVAALAAQPAHAGLEL